MRQLRAAVLIILLGTRAVAAGAEQSRVEADSSQRPWSAIGRVNRTTGGFCTGTLIGPRLVLTAAHCLWNRRVGNWLPASSLHFLAGYSRGAYVGHAEVERYERAADLRMDAQGRPAPRASDWAVLVLASDLGRMAGTIATGELAGGTAPPPALTLVSYSQDKAHVLSIYAACEIRGISPQQAMLVHGCTSRHGSSGSPLLMREAGAWKLVALHVGAIERDGGQLGMAVLPPFNEIRKATRPPSP